MKNKRQVVFIFLAAFLCGGFAARGEDAQALELLVSNAVKVKLAVPQGWKAEADPGKETVTISKGDGVWLVLDFSLDAGGKLTTQKAVNEMVRGLNREYVPDAAKHGPVTFTEMKSKSGRGAYTVATGVAEGGLFPTYAKFVWGGFVTRGVVVVFRTAMDGEPGGDFRQAVKMIGEGIKVVDAK